MIRLSKSSYEVCKAFLFRCNLEQIDEIEIEYNNGKTFKYTYEEQLKEGLDNSREHTLLQWLSSINWNSVEEVEVDFYDGRKRKLEVIKNGKYTEEEEGLEEDLEGEEEEKEDKKQGKKSSPFIQIPINPYKITKTARSGMKKFHYNDENDDYAANKGNDDDDILGEYDFR